MPHRLYATAIPRSDSFLREDHQQPMEQHLWKSESTVCHSARKSLYDGRLNSIFSLSKWPYRTLKKFLVDVNKIDGEMQIIKNNSSNPVTPEGKFASSNDDSSWNAGDDNTKEGLFNVRAISLLVLWYFFSFCTLFLNKYILSTMQGEPTLLGAIQMMATTFFGFLQMYFPCGLYRKNDRSGKPRGFWRNMAIVGCMRFSTVVLGLFALKYISVSFTETVKSTAPLFTVVIAYFLLDERCGIYVVSSLIPVMGGLALCSAYELSFNTMGFLAAIATNLMDCLQNVFSKLLISNSEHKYTPAELQFYTSVASIFVQIPATYFVIDFSHALRDIKQGKMNAALLINGICFHLQSITAYSLMGYISPITHSVANTTKRAILIWLSVIIFGNDVTFWSAAGTALVLIGVLLYNKARNHELKRCSYIANLRVVKAEQI